MEAERLVLTELREQHPTAGVKAMLGLLRERLPACSLGAKDVREMLPAIDANRLPWVDPLGGDLESSKKAAEVQEILEIVAPEKMRKQLEWLQSFHGEPAVESIKILQAQCPVALTRFDAVALAEGERPVLAMYGSEESKLARDRANQVIMNVMTMDEGRYHTVLGNVVDTVGPDLYIPEPGGGQKGVFYCRNPVCSILCVACGENEKGCRRTASIRFGLKLCARCSEAKYCSEACQKEHWYLHKEVCKNGEKMHAFAKLLHKDAALNLIISAGALSAYKRTKEVHVVVLRFASPADLKRGLDLSSWRAPAPGEWRDLPAKISLLPRKAVEHLTRTYPAYGREQEQECLTWSNALSLLDGACHDVKQKIAVIAEVTGGGVSSTAALGCEPSEDDAPGGVAHRVFAVDVLEQNRGITDTRSLGFLAPYMSGL